MPHDNCSRKHRTNPSQKQARPNVIIPLQHELPTQKGPSSLLEIKARTYVPIPQKIFAIMGIRVVARIRPRQQNELGKDVIVSTACSNSSEEDPSAQPTLVRIPNPKNEGEDFTFQFSGVYDCAATQQQIFDNEG